MAEETESPAAPEFTLVQLGKVPDKAIADVAHRVSEVVGAKLAEGFVPRKEIEERFNKVIANQNKNLKDHVEFRRVNKDMADRINQLRRGFGFNGKLDDPEAESLVKETWVEMRALAAARREEIRLEQARALVRQDLEARLGPVMRVWTVARWALLAIISALLWQVGSITAVSVHLYLHLHHLLGQ